MKVVYVSHPYGGKKENEESADKITKILANIFPGITFVSPIHAIRREYSETPYIEGLKCTLEILNRCDGIFMSPGWKESNGCQIERSLAKHREMPIFYTVVQLAIWAVLGGGNTMKNNQTKRPNPPAKKIKGKSTANNVFRIIEIWLGKGTTDVACERAIQIMKYGKDYDAQWGEAGQLIYAAMGYATAALENEPEKAAVPLDWPWTEKIWKPEERRRNLVKAAALLIAEIDRMDAARGEIMYSIHDPVPSNRIDTAEVET